MNRAVGLKGRQVDNSLGRFRAPGLASILALLFLGLGPQSSADAAPTHPFNESLSHEGAFERPCGVATDPEGDLYVDQPVGS
jgi:hypothetical protein